MGLLSASRCQSLHLLCISDMIVGKSSYTFTLNSPVKHSRPGFRSPLLRCTTYPVDKRLCIYLMLNKYLTRIEKLRGEEDQLHTAV